MEPVKNYVILLKIENKKKSDKMDSGKVFILSLGFEPLFFHNLYFLAFIILSYILH